MKKVFNSLFFILKFILLIISFCLSLYIVLSMYKRIDKNIIECIPIFIPYVVLLLLFFINIVIDHKSVNNNLFYNLTCCLSFLCICFVGYRAIYDKNMLLNGIMGYNINFSYFADFISFMKIMIYGLVISDICFIIHEKNPKEIEIARKIEVL